MLLNIICLQTQQLNCTLSIISSCEIAAISWKALSYNLTKSMTLETLFMNSSSIDALAVIGQMPFRWSHSSQLQ